MERKSFAVTVRAADGSENSNGENKMADITEKTDTVFKLNRKNSSWLPEIRVNRMDLEDRRIRRDTPKIKCHERKHNRKGITCHWKTKGKTKCLDTETTKIQKPAQINPLMTVLMSSRPQLDQPTSDDEICTERVPLIAYNTVVLELPENLQYKPATKKSTPACSKLTTRKCIVPDSNKLKLSLRCVRMELYKLRFEDGFRSSKKKVPAIRITNTNQV